MATANLWSYSNSPSIFQSEECHYSQFEVVCKYCGKEIEIKEDNYLSAIRNHKCKFQNREIE
jgi:hypothetical protein